MVENILIISGFFFNLTKIDLSKYSVPQAII
jgi:hypothetical protein